jgi:hypothetical protein
MAATAELNLTLDPMGNSHKNLLKAHHYAYTVQIWALSGLK